MSKPRPAHAEEAMHEQRRIPAWLVLPGILAIVLVGVLAGQMMRPPEVQEGELPDGSPAAADWRPTPPPEGQTFSLAIDFGNGVRKEFAALAWTEGMTVLEALQAATRFRPGVAFSHQGAGESAFVTSIDGLKNAGAGGGNWIYEVNGEKATQSSGVQTLQASDALLWRYAPPE
jgi:hypothetical protein